jgi:CYTH domain-containing protein
MMGSSIDILQSYISFMPEIRLRNVNGTDFVFTLRMPVEEGDVTRRDIEFNLSRDEYNELSQKISGTIIHKARYRFVYDGVSVRLDVFFGHLDGLIFAEVLFDNDAEAEAFMPLHWFGEEITEDRRYRNAMLSRDGMPDGQILIDNE